MLDQFKTFIRSRNLFTLQQKILLAVSGGIDSVVMTDLFYKAGFSFAVAHVNFQLRGEESARDESFVRQLAENYHVEIYVKQAATADYARKHKVSIQVAAREIRYAWFEELSVKQGYDLVATAHHLDDQVETFLINLSRGTGIAGLHGIPVRQGKVIRPLMFTGREEILAYAIENQLSFVEDSSNKSLKYTRNRIRHKIIPQLEKLNPSFKKVLNETIGNISDVEIIYKKAIEDIRNPMLEKRGDAVIISIKEFFGLDPIKAYAFELLSPYGFNLSNINDIIRLKNAIPGKEVLSDTHRLIRDRDELIILPRKDIAEVSEYEVNVVDLQKGIFKPVRLYFELIEKRPAELKIPTDTAFLDLEKLEFPLKIRKWRRGDVFFPFGMTGSKKLSDFFTDLKFSKIDKENQWLLCSGDKIAWIIGQRIDDRFKIDRNSKRILKLNFFP
jgi:tRNA(Ile)-lysidine synthase